MTCEDRVKQCYPFEWPPHWLAMIRMWCGFGIPADVISYVILSMLLNTGTRARNALTADETEKWSKIMQGLLNGKDSAKRAESAVRTLLGSDFDIELWIQILSLLSEENRENEDLLSELFRKVASKALEEVGQLRPTIVAVKAEISTRSKVRP